MNFHAALSKCDPTLQYSCVNYSCVSNTHASAYACVSNRAPACLHGGCGGRQAGKRRGQTTRGHTCPTPARQKMCGHACKYFLFVCRKAIAPQGTKNKRPPRCIRHDKSGTEAVEKKSACVSAKVAVGKSKTTNGYFSKRFCFCRLPCAFFFNCWSAAFGVAYVPRPQTKSACTPFNLLPCRRMAGMCGGWARG
jgi:hypothetical protein